MRKPLKHHEKHFWNSKSNLLRVLSTAASSSATKKKCSLNITEGSSVKTESSSVSDLHLCLPASSAADWWSTWPSFPHRRSSVMTYHKTHHHWLKLINRKRWADYAGFSVNLVVSLYNRPQGLAELVVPVWLSLWFWFSLVFSGLRGLHDTRKQNQDCFFFELEEK